MTALLTRLESLLTPNADGLLPCPLGCEGFPQPIDALGDFWVECGHCRFGSPMTNSAEQATKDWNEFPRPILRALVEAVKTVPCDQDMHARHRVSECDRCALEAKIIAILEGKPWPPSTNS